MVYICFYVIFYVQVGWSDSRWHGQVTGKKHSGLHETVRISDLMPRFCRSCRGDRGEEHCLSMLGVAHSPKCGRENILRECLQEFLQELHPTPATIRHWKRICPWPQNPCQETQNHHKVQELVVYHWNHSGHQLLLSCGPKHPKPDTGGTLKTRSFFSMGCRVGHRVSAALVSGQSRGVSRWTCFMPVWAHDACAQSLVDRSSHAARARGDNKTQGQVFDSVMPGSSVAVWWFHLS